MEKYIIYCTEEQVKKAIALSAPIEHHNLSEMVSVSEQIIETDSIYYNTTTAEQMIGWLEEQGITIESVKCDMYWFTRAYSDENCNFNKGRFISRKEAILAAIDAALDYLSKNKE